MKNVLLLILIGTTFLTRGQGLIEYSELKNQPAYKSMEEALANPSDVIRLELKGEGLHNLSDDLAKLVNLQYLDLSRNEMTEFPIVVTRLEKLQYLNLQKNKITKIPDEIGKLHQLRYLCLNRNNLYVISPAIGKVKNLVEFDLYDNPITTFPNEMVELSKLKELDLRLLDIKEDEKKKLLSQLRHTKIKFSKSCNCN